MVRLTYNLLIAAHIVIFTLSERFVKETYKPYGPKMCQEWCQDYNDSFIYIPENLACHRINEDDAETAIVRYSSSSATCLKLSIKVTGRPPASAKPQHDSYVPKDTGHPISAGAQNYIYLLHQACKEGSLGTVKDILTRKLADIDTQEKYGETPIMTAARHGKTAVFNYLVSQGCNLNLRNSEQNTVLHVICEYGYIEMARRIISIKEVDIESIGFAGRTPVLSAVYYGRTEIIQLFVKNDCNLKAKANDGYNILHVACSGGQVHAVNCTLNLGVVSIESRTRYGTTPVMVAAMKGYIGVVEFLVSKHCNIRAKDYFNDTIIHVACLGGGYNMVKYILEKKLDYPERRGREGLTALMTAARFGHLKVFHLLMRRGCNATAVDYRGKNILSLACIGGEINTIQYIISLRIFSVESRDYFGNTPVILAAQCGQVEVVKLLVNNGCNITVVNNKNNTALHEACISGSKRVVSYILEHGLVDIESRGFRGRTPLVSAAHGRKDVVDLLIHQGCNVNAIDDQNNTILHLACIKGHVGTVKYILRRRIIDVESKGYLGRTPVLLASRFGHIEIVGLLAREGCNMKAIDTQGNNILHNACIGGSVNMVKYVLQLGVVDRKGKNKHGTTPVQFAELHKHDTVVNLLAYKN